MQMFIPEIGFQFSLVEDWKFDIVNESRNNFLINVLDKHDNPNRKEYLKKKQELYEKYDTLYSKVKIFSNSDPLYKECYRAKVEYINYIKTNDTFPYQLNSGTILTIDRIYVRKGASDYSSLSFNLIKATNPELMNKKEGGTITGRRRFFARLDDVNKIKFERIDV